MNALQHTAAHCIRALQHPIQHTTDSVGAKGRIGFVDDLVLVDAFHTLWKIQMAEREAPGGREVPRKDGDQEGDGDGMENLCVCVTH